MGFECKTCNKKFETSESLEQHKKAKHSSDKEESLLKEKKKTKKYLLIGLIILAAAIIIIAFYISSRAPKEYDDFAKCLTEKGAIIYGNDFCQYTNKQLNWFKGSEKYLNYVKCIDSKELCDSKGVVTTPTWEIDGKMYPEVQSFERLSSASGCEI